MNSIGQFGDSPFIYPIYGLGGKFNKKKEFLKDLAECVQFSEEHLC